MGFAAIGGSVLVLALTLAVTSPPPPPFALEEIRIGATDLDASRELYVRHLGFTFAGEAGDGVALVNGGVRVVLHPAAKAARIHYPAAAHAYVNVEVDDLETSRRNLAGSGARFLHQQPRKAAIGHFLAFEDPSGTIHQIFEREPATAVPHPTVFNVGIKVTAMDEARDFYCGTLGFEVFSEDFYPPVLPLRQRGIAALALHESANEKATSDDSEAAATVLVFSTPDLGAALDHLKARGVELLHAAPRPSPTGSYLTFRDPFGNVYELREKAAAGTGTP